MKNLSEETKNTIRTGIGKLSKKQMQELLIDFAFYEVRTMADGEDGITNSIKFLSHVKLSILNKLKQQEKELIKKMKKTAS